MEWAANPSQVTHTKRTKPKNYPVHRRCPQLLQMYLLMNILLATERENNVSVQRKFTLVEDVLYFIFSIVIYQAACYVECRCAHVDTITI